VLALLAPLYWIHDSPATLLVAQGVLFALAIPPLWAYTRRRLNPGAAYFVCVAYAWSLPVMEAVIFDFHEVAFVPVLTAVMVERFDAGRRWAGVLAAAPLLLVKEDMGLLVAGFGIYLLLSRWRSEKWTGLAFVVGGVAATCAATHLLIPAFGGPSLVTFRDERGAELFDVPTAPRPDEDTPAPVRLVAEFDNLVLSHAGRARVISPEATRRLYTINGVVPGSVLIDGFVAGMWRLTRSRLAATVTIEMFSPVRRLDRAQRDALTAEAERVLAFGASGAAHEVRFAPLRGPE
jgi:Predicted membrane protein (DUF2079)/Winged helix DNA-binding domain